MFAVTTDLDDLQGWEVMEGLNIHPVYTVSDDDEVIVHCLTVRVPILPDFHHLIPFANLTELRDIAQRFDSGELRDDIKKWRQEELDRRAAEEPTGDLRLRPPSMYPPADDPSWIRYDITGGKP